MISLLVSHQPFRCGSLMIWKHLKLVLVIALTSILCACHTKSNIIKKEPTELQVIAGRNEGEGRQPVYRMQTPLSWIRHDPLPSETLLDTTKALCEFIILENSDVIRISIHNFPSMQIDDRIPPQAQVARWERQFNPLDKINSKTIQQSFSGYSGLLFSGEGQIDEKQVAMLAWSLVLAPEHYRMLQQAPSHKTVSLYKQMRSDVTIKAVGTIELMRKHQPAIYSFARTFELIREIPTRI
ncbi:MAG: hypothetical protein H0X29_11090 [Parachlamydiaceae bacterium]|nr:hypothetical protein [Parachlamydiaceae bacterium]